MMPRRSVMVVLLLLAVTLAGCSGGDDDDVVESTGPPNPFPVGTCLELPDDGTLGEDDEPVVDCAAPHDAEVFAAIEFPVQPVAEGQVPPYPGVQAFDDLAATQCQPALEAYTGLPILQLDLAISRFVPTEATWADGDRLVVCFAQRPDGAELVGSIVGGATGTVAPTTVVLLPEPGEGQCFNFTPEGGLGGAPVIDCAQLHDAEVFAVVTAGAPEAPFPGDAEIGALSGTECATRLVAYVGGNLPGGLRAAGFNPDATDWELGDRTINCVLAPADGRQVTGSARGLVATTVPAG